jgi:leucyl-tRNA synthetase
LWHGLGHRSSIVHQPFPRAESHYLTESSVEYPISVNGKLRDKVSLPVDLDEKQIEETVLQRELVQKWLEGKAPKKVIVVRGKIVNVVV